MKSISIVVIVLAVSMLPRLQTKPTGNDQKVQEQRETASMREHATATFAVKSWNEASYDELKGAPKLTRVSATKTYLGDIAGEGKVEYLMMYRADGSASFTGLERVMGTVGGRSGSFILQHTGTFEHGTATVRLSVVPGSGTEDLRGIRGEGQFAVGHQPPYHMMLEYGFE